MQDAQRTDNRQFSTATLFFAAGCLVSAAAWYAGEATADGPLVSGALEADAGNAMPAFRLGRDDYGEIVR